ncbi:MAG: hypothetical protein HZA08_14320 [Nitrospirae bacterium]|nr:hypothetical protein [Nitrospirota bacterium]
MFRTCLLVKIAVVIFFITVIPDAYSSAASLLSHNINLTFDLKAHSIDAVDHIMIHSAGDKIFIAYINTNAVIKSVKGVDGANLLFSVDNDEKEGKKRIVVHLPRSSEITPPRPPLNKGGEFSSSTEIIIEYSGRFSELPGDIKFSREFLSDKPVAYAGEEITLIDSSACWYPCTNEPAIFKVTAVTPEHYEIVTEGEKITRKVENGTTVTAWDIPYPSSGIYLVGGRYVIHEEKYNDITIYTYLFPEDVGLSATYLDNSKRYLELYNRLLGRYPFKKFAVVENMLSTGFGMPSYTLLGQSVLRLPFIVKTSLGHEIAHNWWGNSVYPDYESGNWSEGLTTYLADYLYEDMEGKGAAYRNQLLRDYVNLVKPSPSADYPLTKFRNRAVPEDRAIGYGKGAYVFHMMKVMLGEEKFYEGLRYVIKNRSFKVTSWDNFREAFEKVSGKDLRPFFRQWVENSGAPVIRLGEATLSQKEDEYIINISIHQKGRTYEIYLPVLVETEEGNILTYHWIKDPISVIELHSSSRPKAVTVDPYYDVFRRLNQEEVPATIGKFMGSNKRLLILPSNEKKDIVEAYSKIASGVNGVIVKYDKDVSNGDLIMNNIYITGEAYLNISADKLSPELPQEIKIDNEYIYVKGKSYNRNDSVLILTRPNPFNPDSVFLFFSGDNSGYIESAGEKMGHYGKYSYLLFFKGEIAEKGVWEAGMMKKDF